MAVPAYAGDNRNFGDLSIEQLMNESVTSVSKKEQKLSDVAAAVSELSNDDLRRSGATTVAEALRLVPGLDVGSANAADQAVSARGFNYVFSNKLLVLVDGRAVYNPLMSGVDWDLQQTMLEDVDRIEVIRGPGATVWGANAVNGVINIVSASAKDTQGGFVYGGGGNVERALVGWRYGGQTGPNTYYRIFGRYQSTADYPLPDGQPNRDRWQARHGGFRVDHYPDASTHLTWQAEVTATDLDHGESDSYNVNTLGRWTRLLSERSSVEVQAYYDRIYRYKPQQLRVRSDIVDLSAQHTFGLGERNDVIWGLGGRFNVNHIGQTTPFNVVRNGEVDLHTLGAFVQDECKLVPDALTLTAGLKIEHNDYTGFEFQPSFRAVFKPTDRQTAWAAVSRAVRTPDAFEGKNVASFAAGPLFPGPGGGLYLPVAVSNPSLKSEVLCAYELGYRMQPARRVSLDVAVFYNDYRDLIDYGTITAFVPGVPFGTAEMPAANLVNARSYGGETVVTVLPADGWRLTASYSLLRVQTLGARSPVSLISEKNSPRHQAALRSAYDFARRTSLDVQLRYVGAIEAVPSYLTADVRLSYRPSDRVEISLEGQNLLDRQHPEQPAQPAATVISEVPRGFYVKILRRF